ncbi:MAG: cytochrome P450 [Acidimicrobiia bacterium]|nr:cytochrome P450 [Acidimicrobiia bacterium]
MRRGGFEHRGDHPLHPDVNLMDGEFYAREPHDVWTWMRENAPVYHDPHTDVWAVARYDDLVACEKNAEVFSNAQNIRPRMTGTPMMISMDDPEHALRRKLVGKGFTPPRVRAQENRLREICDQLLDAVCERGECDFVWDVAAHLPLIVIADMLGFPPEDRPQLLEWSDQMLKGTTSTDTDALMEAAEAMEGFWAHQTDVIEQRRVCPADDLTSVLVHAEVDGLSLDLDSLVWESLLVLIGGDETTRHVISGGLVELCQHPDQKADLIADPSLTKSAVEEMLRWVSPVKNMNRRVTRDTDVRGQHLREGDDVLMLYPSANRDEDVFEDPFTFDIRRHPNLHVAFGFGPHFCMGSALARLELRVLFEHLMARMPDIDLAIAYDDLPRRPSSFVSGFESVPVTFTPSAPVGASA